MLKQVVLLLVLVVGCVNVGCTPPVGDSDGIVFLPVTPRGSIEIDGTTFDVEPFYIAKYETTNAQYAAFVQAADGFDDPAWWNDMPAEYSPPQQGLFAPRSGPPNAPRAYVSWYQAV
ncbi:MAG: SUMF1/EgtB/PvdO family nonheme iron enzyme, partial [Candidatus Poribacteria bacterium]